MEKYTEKIDRFMIPYLEKEGYRHILTQFTEEDGSFFLRMFIDLGDRLREERTKCLDPETLETEEGIEKQAGVEISDCVKVSRYLSKWLDQEDFIKEMYTLEVCSRGFMN